jgi:hypothetical protein
LRWLLIVGLSLGLLGLGAWRLDTASGQGPTVSIGGVPGSVAAGGAAFNVQISIAGVTNLAAYEWQLSFDPNVVAAVVSSESPKDGTFLGSTGRSVFCPSTVLDAGSVRFGCATSGSAGGPNGGDLLSTVAFQPVGNGAPNIHLVCAGLADPFGNDMPASNVPACVSPVTPTPTLGPGETPAPSETPGPGETPTPTSTPGGAPAATATPAGPVPTPTPLPPGMEAVSLVAGCTPVASTYADATPIGTIADAVGPAGNLISLWMFDVGTWRAYSPQFPEVSDLTEADFLDVVFVCVAAPGALVRLVV